MSAHTSISLVAGAAALVVAGLALWRSSRPWLAAALVLATVEIAVAAAWAWSLGGHRPETQVLLGAGVVALLALMIRFGLHGVARQLAEAESGVSDRARGSWGRGRPVRSGRRTRTASARSAGSPRGTGRRSPCDRRRAHGTPP